MNKFDDAICECGAVTVRINNNDYSMPKEKYIELFPDRSIEDIDIKYCSCNYCVNHWGIDLCGCGSGEKFGECKENFPECKNPAQDIEHEIVHPTSGFLGIF